MMVRERILPERWQCTYWTCLGILGLIAVIFTVLGIVFISIGMTQAAIGFFAAAVLIIFYIISFVASRFNSGVPQEQQNQNQMQLLAAMCMGIRDHPLAQWIIRKSRDVRGPPPAPQGHDQRAVEMVPMADQR
ncbi:uncharacterized protein LOC120262513 [Dioscorea cayenensis subsp. rotundata]|uniref:Uncharacterized protein LOC120262513 n=1 Tax=Dioscorea cayennensis subsp. rotundata TaxID=55577 RepID=A0AB40BI19_DIOCR|nr:uncharacterized protein LOC120262513 [Dioscorea cayenensis subsp. rotundata]